MNKKVNTVLFILGATIFNVLVIGILYFICYALLILVYNESMNSFIEIVFMGIMLGSIVGGFFIYRVVLKIISKKIDMDKYFEPLFSRRKK
jgi:hypothetical protein